MVEYTYVLLRIKWISSSYAIFASHSLLALVHEECQHIRHGLLSLLIHMEEL